MATTPNLTVTLLESSQSQKEITVNEALQRLDAVLNMHALDKDLSTPPATPSAGDTYIVGVSATDVWAGKEGQIAYFQQIWHFIEPRAGFLLWVADEAKYYSYSGSSWAAFEVSGGASGGSYKNILINGDFELWQRGNSFNQFSMQYGPDRWILDRALPGNVMIRCEETTANNGFRRALHIQRNLGDTNTYPIRVEQSIETRNAVRMQGQEITLSFYVRMGANFQDSLFKAELFSGTGTNELALAAGFTGESTLATIVPAQNASWQRVFATVAAPTSMTQLAVRLTYSPTAIAGDNDWVEITGMQLEAASAPTDYEFMDYSIALFRAQRYFEKSFVPDTKPIRNSGDTVNAARMPQLVGASAGMYAELSFTVEKRTAPTITFYNPSADNAKMRNRVNNQDCASTSALDIGTKGLAPFCVTPAGSSAGQQLIVHYSADAEIY